MTVWLVETLYAVTLLMLLVLAVRKPVAHFFGAGWAYALWLLPALRLVLPPLHIFGTAIPSVLPPAPAVTSSSVGVTAALPAEAASAFAWEPVLLAVWAAGAVLFALWQAWSYHAFLRRLGIGSRIHASLAQDIGIVESAEVEGPIAIGLLDRWIVVPADFASRYSPTEQRLALRHERIHHQREDIFFNMLALGVLALNWFNPIAYLAFRAFRADQELSCDAAVAAGACAAERHDYARALVKSASKPGLVAACPLNHAGQLKQRLRMMKEHRKSGLRALGGSGAVGLLILGGISVTEAGVAQPPAPVAVARAAPTVEAAPAAPAKKRANAAMAPRAIASKPVRTKAPAAPAARTRVKAALAPVAEVETTPAAAPAPEAPPVPEAAPMPEAAPAAPTTMTVENVVRVAMTPVPGHKMQVTRTHIRAVHRERIDHATKVGTLLEARARGLAIRIAPKAGK